MAKTLSNKIRYANHVVSRSDLEEALKHDIVYQRAVKGAVKAKTLQREAEQAREQITLENTRPLTEEREASRTERALRFARRRVKELIAERDAARRVAHNARVSANRKMRRAVSSNNILIRRHQGEFREAFDTANDRKSKLFSEMYAENYKGILDKSSPDEDEEFNDDNLGLIPDPEEEDQGDG